MDLLALIIATNLRRIRQERGWSQEQAAERLGVHRTWIGSIEQGRRNLTLRSVERLADRLGVSAEELLTWGEALAEGQGGSGA